MKYMEDIRAFSPSCAQEESDQRSILWYVEQFPGSVLTRENVIAHITSSGLVVNDALDRALFIHHNILGQWAWTGGHADGDPDLLSVAVREAMEETGATHIAPLSDRIASLDVLWVPGHVKRGRYVSDHLHLSVAYILRCDEGDPLAVKPDENSGVRWFALEDIAEPLFTAHSVGLYRKLIDWAARHA